LRWTRVAILYGGMTPEIIAPECGMLACARIRAPHTIVLLGFALRTTIDRIQRTLSFGGYHARMVFIAEAAEVKIIPRLVPKEIAEIVPPSVQSMVVVSSARGTPIFKHASGPVISGG